MKKSRGQSLMEYAVLTVCIVAALVAMQVYLRRSIQGRIKQTADTIGDPYDPENIDSTTNSRLTSTQIVNQTQVILDFKDPYDRPVTGMEIGFVQDADIDRETHDKVGK